MVVMFVPLKKLRRSGRYVLLGAVLLAGAAAVYLQMLAAGAGSSVTGVSPDSDGSSWRRAMPGGGVKGHQPRVEDSAAWRSTFIPQAWKPEYQGWANLHVFEDWCGGSTADLRQNLHYPLNPHSRTTVQKLAVSPQWTNYGLRIFGYLHPYADGEFVFALSSDDNSEFWLSTDESPLNVKLLARVGKTGTEWTAPGEFDKFASQTSQVARLSAQRKYFFEVVHKQNDKGTDHVEVAWQLVDQDFRFRVIESKHISLYVNESDFFISDVAHIPQTAASHRQTSANHPSATADMLRNDTRDSFYRVPLIDAKHLEGVLPDCSYKPSYTIKDFPLLRYQGLQFIHLSYIYPNDYTRLAHMEEENSCFYPESPYYMKMFGFSRYMRLDPPNRQEWRNAVSDFGFQRKKSILEEDNMFGNDLYPREDENKAGHPVENAPFADYGDDYDDYVLKRQRKLFSLQDAPLRNSSHASQHRRKTQRRRVRDNSRRPQQESQSVLTQSPPQHMHTRERISPKIKLKTTKRQKFRSVGTRASTPGGRERPGAKERLLNPSEQHHTQKSQRMNQRPKLPQLQPSDKDLLILRKRDVQPAPVNRLSPRRETTRPSVSLTSKDARQTLREKEIEMNMPLQQDVEDRVHRARMTSINRTGPPKEDAYSQRATRGGDREYLWGQGADFEGADDEDVTPAPVFDTEVNWSQTFQVNTVDLQALRSDWIDLHCNVSGNLLLRPSDALPIVTAFMEHLNDRHPGSFTLVRVVNVVKRVDGVLGSRYLLELELEDLNGQRLRLSRYIYALIRSSDVSLSQPQPQLLLCNPLGFLWNPSATIHFIVPVKNQARWVQKLIDDMEDLFRVTGDANFNLIITDYNSTDMDVRKALEKSSLPRYQYVKLSGNFERSAGLQAGVNLINDKHSIVFLCDLHIQFPPVIIDTIRKHCVEGYMAFAPIVMRLNCGATPFDARGYWEVNGFGLLGIYKSDLDAVGGMNVREFTDRWGGEDWELLDRILQAGLEVERIYVRNFFHHYHSKRGMWNRRMSPNHR